MVPEEKLKKSKELLEINRKKIEDAQIQFSQLNLSQQVVGVVTESQPANIQEKNVKDELKTTEKKHPRTSQSVPIFVETYHRNLDEIYDELFWGYEIKEIQVKENNPDTINITGWVLGKKCPVVAIEVVFLSSIIKKVSVDRSYPDLVKSYPQASQQTEIGFNIEFILNKLPPKFNWLIQAVFADETRMPIGSIQSHQTKSLNISQTPLITQEAIQFLEKFLQEKPDAKLLEFGSGGSTIWLSKLTKNLTSIEHDGRWFQQVKNYIQKQKNCHPVDIQLLPRPYHTICEKLTEASFDLIIVDGRDRMKCFEASIKLVKPGGILMLDDAQRGRYQKAHDLLKDWQFTKTVSQARDTYWWEKPFPETISTGKNQSTSQQESTVSEIKESVVIPPASVAKEENRLFQIQNAIFQSIIVRGQTWVGGVVFPDDMPEKFRHRRGTTLNKIWYIDEPSSVISNNSKFYSGTYVYGGRAGQHFGHGLTESIHRLWAFNSNIHDGIVFATRESKKGIKYTPPRWFIQALEILEIPLAKCIWANNNCTFENLIIPEPGSELSIGLKEWYRPYLEKRQQKIFDATHHLRKNKKDLKLFLGRTHLSLSGYTAGEKYLENLLVNEGYISLKSENYDLLEQISYLMSAKKIIFSEGSAIYSLELINYLDADIACLPRRPDNQHFYPHIYSKCRNYIVAGNTNDILRGGIWRNDRIELKQMPINKHPDKVVESLRNNDFALLKDWDEAKFLAQEKSDIMAHIYEVHTRLEKPNLELYLQILEGYLKVRKNENEISNKVDYLKIIEGYLQGRKNPNENPNDETNKRNYETKNRSDRLNQLATINQSSKYLEIGVSKGITFNAINIKNKVAVDPKFRFNTKKYASENVVFLEVTSDEFFRNHAKDFQPFDLIYLDGLHTFEQTFRDFCASLSLAHAKTIWLIDDTCPGSYAQVQPLYQNCAKLKQFSQEKGGFWMGDVFKVVAAIHDFFPQFSLATFPDHGQTVVWNQWRADFQPKWNSLETISRLEYLDFVELQETLFKRAPYEKIFESIKSAINSQ